MHGETLIQNNPLADALREKGAELTDSWPALIAHARDPTEARRILLTHMTLEPTVTVVLHEGLFIVHIRFAPGHAIHFSAKKEEAG